MRTWSFGPHGMPFGRLALSAFLEILESFTDISTLGAIAECDIYGPEARIVAVTERNNTFEVIVFGSGDEIRLILGGTEYGELRFFQTMPPHPSKAKSSLPALADIKEVLSFASRSFGILNNNDKYRLVSVLDNVTWRRAFERLSTELPQRDIVFCLGYHPSDGLRLWKCMTIVGMKILEWKYRNTWMQWFAGNQSEFERMRLFFAL